MIMGIERFQGLTKKHFLSAFCLLSMAGFLVLPGITQGESTDASPFVLQLPTSLSKLSSPNG